MKQRAGVRAMTTVLVCAVAASIGLVPAGANEGPSDDPFAVVTAEVETWVHDTNAPGAALVVVDEEHGVVYEEYFGEFTADRSSITMSSVKMISAGVLLRLADDGLLDMNQPIREQVRWADRWTAHDATPAQLLSNSSGLMPLVSASYVVQYNCTLLWSDLQACGKQILNSLADNFAVIGRTVHADTEFRYGGGQWQVAGAVAEAVSGKSWQQLVDETYGPCGVESLGWFRFSDLWPTVVDGWIWEDIISAYPTYKQGNPEELPATDNPTIEGGAYITAADYADILLMHLRGGRCGDTQVLSQAALDLAHTDRIGPAYNGNAGISGSADPNLGYGLGWWVERDTGQIYDPGAFGAEGRLDVDDGYGYYLAIEGGAGPEALPDLVDDAITAFRAPEPPVSLDPPARVEATVAGADVMLDWSRVEGAFGYLIHRDYEFVAWVPASATAWTDSGLTSGEAYRYQVRSQASDRSHSSPTPAVSVRVFDESDLPVFGAPSDVTATVTGPEQVTVSWQQVQTAERYVIHRDGAYRGWVSFGADSFVDAMVADGETHRYVVRAQTADGAYSPPSEAAIHLSPDER